MVQDWQRDYSRRQQVQPDRLLSNEHTPHNSIDRALREQCRIPAQCYFVTALLENGTTATFSGPTDYKDQIPTFFNMQKWIQCVTGQSPQGMANSSMEEQDLEYDEYHRMPTRSRRQDQAYDHMHGRYQGFGMGFDYDGHRAIDQRRRIQADDEMDDSHYPIRKRARAAHSRRATDMLDDVPARILTSVKVPIRVEDTTGIWNLYDLRFRNLQQTACKLIAKAWVKLVEPKKQSTHPYTGSDEKAPEWWPKAWGPTRDERVRHKEPDHLYKKERVHLLKHIVRMIVLPNAQQHPDIQKLGLTVSKLEEATTEALSSFFADKDNPNNAKKRPYLREIFLLARNEEKFLNGEIDGSTCVYIRSDDKIPDNYQSDNEESGALKDEDDHDTVSGAGSGSQALSAHRPNVTAMLPPASTTIAAMTNVSPTNDHASNNSLTAGASAQAFMRDALPHRSHQQYPPPQMLHPDIGTEPHSSYLDPASIPVGGSAHGGMSLQEICPPTNHESNRRSSMFTPTSDFSTPATSAVYQTWPQTSTTSASTSPLYTAFPPQQTPSQSQQVQVQSQAVTQVQVPPPAQQGSYASLPALSSQPQGGYMSHQPSYDAIPRATGFETTQSSDSLFRTGNLPPPGTVNPQASYSMHIPQPHHDGRHMSSHSLKSDPTNRAHMH